ncbi:ATP-binding protein [Streptomyces blastmyceticus]|uniref:AAA+ ATPase domain-containing protein n=1 Tax=Streptomyces blastmyceticus TaxID=68180 RepID=A0ABP3HQ88_9ACTN
MHFLPLLRTRTLFTDGLRDTAHAVADGFASRSMVCLTGLSGIGKTFAVRTVLASHPPCRRAPLMLPARPAPADLRAALHDVLALPGLPPADPGVADALILKALARIPRIVAVDEAHQLSDVSFEYLRYLYDTLPGGLCIVLIAGQDGEPVLRAQRMLASRTAAWLHLVPLHPLHPHHVPGAISRLHPLWQHTDPELLRRVDARFARGRLRHWALLTHHTHHVLTRAGARSVTPELLQKATHRIGLVPCR